MLALVNASKPFYEMLGGTGVRLVQQRRRSRQVHPDDRIRDGGGSGDQPRRASQANMRMQGLLTAWRTMLPGGVEIDVFKDVEA